MSQYLTADFLKFFIPLIGAVITWFFNEHRKQKIEEYQKKEEKYQALIRALRGFYISVDKEHSRELKQVFLDQLDQCWLYCPDEVIEKGYAFLMTVHTGVIKIDEEKEKALGEFILSIRKDLFSHRFFKKTKLTSKDFKILSAT